MMPQTPAVKICGIRDPVTAAACVDAGADAVGLVFYPPSPRHVGDADARAVARTLPPTVPAVGVFVDMEPDAILRRCAFCGLRVVQLHGSETPVMAQRLAAEGLRVIKSLKPPVDAWPDFFRRFESVAAWLVECGVGSLPGGNGVVWNWHVARSLSGRVPYILAGGLSSANVVEAVRAACPDAVDVSSAVESAPGVKDVRRIRDFVAAVRTVASGAPLRPVFSYGT